MKGDIESSSERKGLKITVFGAGGAVGSILVGLLQQMSEVSQITCVDRDLKRMYKFLKSREKLIHIVTDLDTNTNGDIDEKVIRVLNDHFLIINAASSKYNRKIMNAAVAVGAHYFDFASLDDKEAEQKTFHARFKRKNIAAWINRGIGPGLTNDLAVKLMKGLKKCRIMIRVAEHTKLKKDENGNEPLIFLWKPDLVVDEMISPVYVTSKDPQRALIVREPFSGSEDCKFPYPIGLVKCRYMNENEDITIKYLLNFYEIDVKTGGDDVERLYRNLPKIKKKIAKGQIKKYLKELKTPSPDEIKKMIDEGIILDGRVAILVEVNGEDPATKKRVIRKATWMGLSIREVPRGTTHINYNTALIASFAIQQMIKVKRLKPGVWAPEEIPETNREIILEYINKKTNPIVFETS